MTYICKAEYSAAAMQEVQYCTEVGTELEKTLVVFRLSPEFEELYKATQAHT